MKKLQLKKILQIVNWILVNGIAAVQTLAKCGIWQMLDSWTLGSNWRKQVLQSSLLEILTLAITAASILFKLHSNCGIGHV